jgi:hypothetical protein
MSNFKVRIEDGSLPGTKRPLLDESERMCMTKQEIVMWQIAIRTRVFSLSTRARKLIDRYLRLTLGRERFRMSAVSLDLRKARVYGTYVELAARLVIRSPQFQQITIRDYDSKLGRLLVRLVRRARYVGRWRYDRRGFLSRPPDDRLSLSKL